MGSISESARRNFVSQSAVSQAIKKLESALKTSLSTHQKQQFEPTEEGKIVFRKAEEIFSVIRSLHDELGHYENNPRTPLHFVTTHSIGLSLMPDFLADFRATYPAVDLHFQFGGLTQIKGWLKQGIAEFALLLDSPYLAEYQKISLYKGQFRLYKHPNEMQSVNQVGVYVEHKEGLLVPEFQTAYTKLHKHPFPIAGELNSWEFIARTLEHANGYGLVPDFVTLQKNYSQLVPIAKPTVPYSLNAVYHKGKRLSYSAATFLDAFKKALTSRNDE